MSRRRIAVALLAFLLTGVFARASSATLVVDNVGGWDFGPKITFKVPPSFAIAGEGVRFRFDPAYSTSGIVIGPVDGSPPPSNRSYHCTLASGPEGMTITPEGIMEWIPSTEDVGLLEPYSIHCAVFEVGVKIFEGTANFTITILESLPKLAEIPSRISYEQNPSGWSTMIFSDYQPTDADRKLFRWSLIDPPPGVYIDASGGLHWADDRGYAREEPYTFKVRIDYETASGSLSDEVTYSRRVLPRPAENNYGDLRVAQPQAYGMLGISISAADGWLAAGEPFSPPGDEEPGRVRLWKMNAGGTNYAEHSAIEPEEGAGALAFGASVALSKQDAQHPTRLAVGAPETIREGPSGESRSSVGCVFIYACDESGSWGLEAQLDPPSTQALLYTGGWVALHGDCLLASMEGMNSAGPNTGAVAVYRHGSTGWEFSQTLEAPDPAAGNFFGYPSGVSGDWIAAAANEDDGAGENAGAVHLFEKQGGEFVHRQKIFAPAPEAGSLFGERLLIRGSWLFVSSFREQSNTGSVHVYRLEGGTWSHHQTLQSPFAEPGSAFGVSLSCEDNVLAVSAPGFIYGDPAIDGSSYPWSGITLFELKDGLWRWSRQVTTNPHNSLWRTSWGLSLAQPSANLTVAASPDVTLNVSGEYFPLAGRLFLHRWPTPISDPFSAVLAALPEIEGSQPTAHDDSNGNGVSNLIDWLMGVNPGEMPDSFGRLKRIFLRQVPDSRGMRLMVPGFRPGLRHQVVVEVSENLSDWDPVSNARWEALETVYQPVNGSNYALSYHPVFIPIPPGDHPALFYRLRIVE